MPCLLTAVVLAAPASVAAGPSLEERVAAQDAIERLYYSHQIGAARTFEESVSRSVLETKVRTALLESDLLASFWNRPITLGDLSEEWSRIRARTRFPERLAEIRRALSDDDRLVLECFVRPILADRWARLRFQDDERIHYAARASAERLRSRLLVGPDDGSGDLDATPFVLDLRLDPSASDTAAGAGASRSVAARMDGGVHLVTSGELEEWRNKASSVLGAPGPVLEEPDAFLVVTRIEETPSRLRLAVHRIEKEPFDRWIASRMAGAPRELSASRSGMAGLPSAFDPLAMSSAGAGAGLFRPDAETWSATSTSNAPSARYRHTAVWTGNVMIVWGGQQISGFAGTGGRYDPTTDSWTATATVGAPVARTDHTAVWTGDRMVVWGGGQSFPSVLQSPGGRYDPISDTWTAVSTVGAPEYRRALASVWTGTEMIVWGGRTNSSSFPSVAGRYNPATDSWTLASQTGAPIGTELLAAVWTGTEMIVWGGEQNGNIPSAVKNTGGRYNPSLDQWAPTSQVNAPSARAYLSGVWTGSRLLIWGGFNWAVDFNDGAQYDPITNTWTTMSTTGAPGPRDSYLMVWTGSEMIVWSGSEDNVNFNTGGLYDPVHDTWKTMTTVGAPSARRHSMGVWMGKLIAWGGYFPTSTGGVYSPAVVPDVDGDGFPTPADCNDSDPTTYPGAPQACDGRNNDCLDPGWPSVPTGEADSDGDSYRSCSGDCDDTRASVHPGAPQICDGLNNDCSDPTWPQPPEDEVDHDGDGFRTCAGDCDDADPAIHPGASEPCDGRDNNCNGAVDEDLLGVDTDGDGVHNACDNCRTRFNQDQLDTDADTVGNACDNCLHTANPQQSDLDADGIGDVCDDCALDYDPAQIDADGDRRGDVCDNCASIPNPDQSDIDHDGEGDVCDLSDGMILFTLVAKGGLRWQDESPYSAFNLYRSSLERLLLTGEYTQDPASEPEAMHWCGLPGAQQADAHKPPVGRVNLYLVTGLQSGIESSLGARSDGSERPNAHPCP